MKRIITLSTSALLLGGLAACNEGGGTGTISLAITDAPVVDAKQVFVRFKGVTLHSAGNDDIQFIFCDNQPTASDAQCNNPTTQEIELKSLTGDISQKLIDTSAVPAGRYTWIRLDVDLETPGRIILLDDSEYPLSIPSGEESGLKLNNGFTVEEGETASFTIDFDLRKSVHLASGPVPDYVLRPTLRIVDNKKTGTIEATLDSNLMVPGGCDQGTAIYVFEGANVTPDDIDKVEPNPVSSVQVEMGPPYTYKIGFLEAGEYTVAFTCDADIDDIDTSDAVGFSATSNATVTVGNITPINLP